ncbi:MAG: GntR family transcriptional regulator [Rhizobiaceae bacterium]|nr:GntR family transcriptional regulator [Rhizobiaceae bacterium]
MESGRTRIRDSSASLYEQVRRDLLARISGGEFGPGDLLPTEEALCREYDVSRITVRRAVADLASNFVVTRKRGVGTIVTRRLSDRRVFRLTGFFDESSSFETNEILSVVVPAREDVAEALQIEPGSPVRHSRTVAVRNGEPFTVTDGYTLNIEAHDGPGVPARGEGGRLGSRVARAEQELAATRSSALVAKHLGIAPGRPVMFARRDCLSGDDRPVRYTISTYHPDRYRFLVDLRPGHDNPMFEASPAPKART